MQRRTAFHQLTTLLTVTIAFALFAGSWFLTSPAAADHGQSDTEQVVRDFYAAVNETVRAGNASALDEIIAGDFEAHSNLASVAPDRAGLVRYLLSLHATFPHLALTVSDVVVTNDRAIADVSVEVGSGGTFLGGSLRGGTPWGETDAFRVTDHHIAEIWSGTQDAVLLESGARAPFDVVDPPERNVTLDRLTIPAGASYSALSGEEQRWLVVESGTVSIASLRRESTKVMELGSSGDPAQLQFGPTEQREPAIFEPGDLVHLPIWSTTEITNVGPEPGSVLVLAAGSPFSLGAIPMDPGNHSAVVPDEQVAGWPGWLNGAPRTSKSGAILASLTGTITATLPEQHTTVAFGQMTLAPETTLSIQLAGPHLLVVDSGLLELITEGEPAWINHDRGLDLHAGALGPGAGALLRTDSVAHFRNSGDQPVALTIIAIVPSSVVNGDAA